MIRSFHLILCVSVYLFCLALASLLQKLRVVKTATSVIFQDEYLVTTGYFCRCSHLRRCHLPNCHINLFVNLCDSYEQTKKRRHYGIVNDFAAAVNEDR